MPSLEMITWAPFSEKAKNKNQNNIVDMATLSLCEQVLFLHVKHANYIWRNENKKIIFDKEFGSNDYLYIADRGDNNADEDI